MNKNSTLKNLYINTLQEFDLFGEILMNPDEIDPSLAIPESWPTVFSKAGNEAILEIWKPLLHHLPSIANFLNKNLQAPALFIEEGGEASLLYPFFSSGELCFYRGLPPLQDYTLPKIPHWNLLPGDIQKFYREIHNGWTFLSANSMGPLPIDDFGLISDLDISPEDQSSMEIEPGHLLRTFHNGAGDYLCINLEKHNRNNSKSGALWWHESPGKIELVDFWPTMDAWIHIFLEDAKENTRREN